MISLTDAAERRARMKELLDARNLPFRFVDAVDGRDEDLTRHPLYNRSMRLSAYGRDMLSGEIGCFLAHKKCYELIVSERLEAALILEDDVILSEDFPEVLNDILDTGIEYDLIRFLGHPKIIARGLRPVVTLRSGHALGRVKSTPGGGYAYLLSLAGARKLLEATGKTAIYAPIDVLLGRHWATKINGYAVLSELALSSDDQSTSFIGQERFSKHRASDAPPFLVLTKAWFKTRTAMGKRWMYWSTYWRDLTLGNRQRRNGRPVHESRGS